MKKTKQRRSTDGKKMKNPKKSKERQIEKTKLKNYQTEETKIGKKKVSFYD